MGMFDDLKCKYPLPPDGVIDTQTIYQTKSLACFLDLYEIREDGTLWHEDYDTEDHSDPDATPLRRIAGMLTRVNERWIPVDLTGEVVFYGRGKEFSAYFVEGNLKELHQLHNRYPDESRIE